MKIFQITLFISISKIQIESKSQPNMRMATFIQCCLSVFQRYKLKANHNIPDSPISDEKVVYQYFKDTN